jgi:D-alanine-D-alanine ligase-like ATP-grasp enzyme
MDVDAGLLKDSRAIAKHFNLQTVGVDYMVGHNGEKYLLEVNHIPNVTVFPFVNEAFVGFAHNWIKAAL